MSERTPQTQDKYVVRFPEGMRDKIAEAAKANNRSMNAEIIDRLELTLDPNRLVIRSIEDVPELAALQKKMDLQLTALERHNDEIIRQYQAQVAHAKQVVGDFSQKRDWTAEDFISELSNLMSRIIATKKSPEE